SYQSPSYFSISHYYDPFSSTFSSFFFLLLRRPPRSTLFPTRRSSDLTRSGKRSAAAAVRIAVEMANEGLISQEEAVRRVEPGHVDRKSTRLNSSHSQISYAVFCLKKKKRKII